MVRPSGAEGDAVGLRVVAVNAREPEGPEQAVGGRAPQLNHVVLIGPGDQGARRVERCPRDVRLLGSAVDQQPPGDGHRLGGQHRAAYLGGRRIETLGLHRELEAGVRPEVRPGLRRLRREQPALGLSSSTWTADRWASAVDRWFRAKTDRPPSSERQRGQYRDDPVAAAGAPPAPPLGSRQEVPARLRQLRGHGPHRRPTPGPTPAARRRTGPPRPCPRAPRWRRRPQAPAGRAGRPGPRRSTRAAGASGAAAPRG